MALAQPISSSFLNNPDHSALHRIIAADVTAPVQSLNVIASGNVGIGTTNPGALLNVSGTSTSNQSFLGIQVNDGSNSLKIGTTNNAGQPYAGIWIDTATPSIANYAFLTSGGRAFFNAASADMYFRIGNADKMIILSTGNVGIGTTGPNEKLEVNGIVAIGNTTDGLQIYKSAAGVGTIKGVDTAGSAYNALELTTGSTAVIRLTTAGNVGIGTTNPSQLANRTNLRIAGGAYGGALVIDSAAAEAGIFRLWFDSGTAPVFNIGNETANDLAFRVGGAEKMRIQTTTGNVGIGTTTPTAVLHLKAGTATASTAPLKFTSGVNLTTPVSGNMEYDNKFSLTESDNVRRFVVQSAASTKVTAAAPYTNDGYVEIVINGTTLKVMTCA